MPRKFMLNAVIPPILFLGNKKNLLTVGLAPSLHPGGFPPFLHLMPSRYKPQRDSLLCAFLSVLWISQQLLEDEHFPSYRKVFCSINISCPLPAAGAQSQRSHGDPTQLMGTRRARISSLIQGKNSQADLGRAPLSGPACWWD